MHLASWLRFGPYQASWVPTTLINVSATAAPTTTRICPGARSSATTRWFSTPSGLIPELPMSSEVEGKVQWASAWVPHQGGAINFVKFICRSGACHSAECTMDNSTCTSALGTAGWSTEYIGSYFLVYFGACCLACPHCSRLGQDGPGLLAANRLGFPNDEHVAVSPAAHAPAPCSHALHLVYAGAHWTCLATLRNASHASNEFEPGTTGHLRLSRPCKCCRARARPRWLRDHECLTSPVLQCLT